MKVSELLKRDIAPFLYGAFMSRIMEKNIEGLQYFYCYTSFKVSKVVPERLFKISEYGSRYIEELNYISGVSDWTIVKSDNSEFEARLYLKNDLNISKTAFFNLLYSKFLNCKWIHDQEINDDKKDFIRGFIELRGSIDTTAKYIAQDYYFNNRKELKKAQIITDFMNVPINYANYNMRDLQHQYVAGINRRNPQFRINSFYYASKIGFLNKYKAEIFKRAYLTLNNNSKTINNIIYFDVNLPRSNSSDVLFIKYLNFFSNNIYEKNLTVQAVSELRKKLGFNNESISNIDVRDRTIIGIFDMIAPDVCAICGTTTTYQKPDGRQYFEIHHVISRCNGKELDNIANLVKLCPTCHRKMKKNSCSKNEQLRAILKILNEHNEIQEFCSSYLDINDINELSEKIWSLLG